MHMSFGVFGILYYSAAMTSTCDSRCVLFTDMAIYLSIIIDDYFKDTHLVSDGFQYQVTVANPADKAKKRNCEEAQKIAANKFDGLVKAPIDIIANKALDYFDLNAKDPLLDAKPMEIPTVADQYEVVVLSLPTSVTNHLLRIFHQGLVT